MSETAEAINDEKLVDTALHMFRGGGDGGRVSPKASTVPKAVKTEVVGIAKGPSNHLVRQSRRERQSEEGENPVYPFCSLVHMCILAESDIILGMKVYFAEDGE